MDALKNAFQRLDNAQLALDNYAGLFYAPYQLDEPMNQTDRACNERYYRETRKLAHELKGARKEVISCARMLLQP